MLVCESVPPQNSNYMNGSCRENIYKSINWSNTLGSHICPLKKNWSLEFFSPLPTLFSFFNLNLFKLEANYFTILYWFCHTSTWIHHRYTRVHPSLLPPRIIPLGHPSAPAPSIQYHASNLDWRFVSCMILYMFQCHSPKSSHPCPLPQSPQECSIHLCLLLSRIQGYRYHLSKFHIYALVYCIDVFLSGLLHSV